MGIFTQVSTFIDRRRHLIRHQQMLLLGVDAEARSIFSRRHPSQSCELFPSAHSRSYLDVAEPILRSKSDVYGSYKIRSDISPQFH